MNSTTLISPAELAPYLSDGDWAIVDCRFSLDNPSRGLGDYQKAHIPGALYAHLDDDLSGVVVPGKTGRHPLPEIDTFARRLGSWGIGSGVQVVVYDDAGGAYAARLWWMLRWVGHDTVAVLNGGWPQWLGESRPTRAGIETRSPRQFNPLLRPGLVVDAPEIDSIRQDPGSCLVDARSSDRFQGMNETIDPVAGHIPGAVSAPYAENLDQAGLFLSPEALRTRYEAILAGVPPAKAAFYCGSGVSAAHNLLALAHAGLDDSRLYIGSWSEWITDQDRPIATGVE